MPCKSENVRVQIDSKKQDKKYMMMMTQQWTQYNKYNINMYK